MVKVPAEDRKQVAQVIDGIEYRARDGFFDMPDAHAKRHLESAGYGGSWHVPGVPSHRAGHRCECGFATFFRKCSRCGKVRDASA